MLSDGIFLKEPPNTHSHDNIVRMIMVSCVVLLLVYYTHSQFTLDHAMGIELCVDGRVSAMQDGNAAAQKRWQLSSTKYGFFMNASIRLRRRCEKARCDGERRNEVQ